MKTLNRKKLLILVLFFLSGCFLVISHNEQNPSIISVHLLPPKIEEKPVKEPLKVTMAIFPFEFDLKFSEIRAPVFFDYSHLTKEFIENLSSALENGIVSSVEIVDKDIPEEGVEKHLKFLKEKRLDLGLWGKITKFEIYKRRDGWVSSIDAVYYLGLHTGELLKENRVKITIDKQVYPEKVTLDYQVALSASAVFNKLYNEVMKDIATYENKIEAERIPREFKTKGIVTLRRGSRLKGKARVLVDVRMRILISHLTGGLIKRQKSLEEEVKEFIEEMKKNEQYKVIITIKDSSETLYPLKDGKLVYDSNTEMYAINYITTRKFNVSSGKALVVANAFLPKISETIVKGTYVDINPEKGLSLGFNFLCETKNNYVDMTFVK